MLPNSPEQSLRRKLALVGIGHDGVSGRLSQDAAIAISEPYPTRMVMVVGVAVMASKKFKRNVVLHAKQKTHS